MKSALEMEIKGIKCDNPNCDFSDMDVKVEEYSEWVNKPCPKCGENLLTEVDFRNTQFLLEIVKVANKIYPKLDDNEPTTKMEVKMDGSGDIDFDIKE